MRVKEEIESWAVGILADYAHVFELLTEFGPNLRMQIAQRRMTEVQNGQFHL